MNDMFCPAIGHLPGTPGTQRALSAYSEVTQTVLGGYSEGTQGELRGYSEVTAASPEQVVLLAPRVARHRVELRGEHVLARDVGKVRIPAPVPPV